MLNSVPSLVSRQGGRPLAVLALAGALLIPGRVFAAVTITTQRGAHAATVMYADGDRVRIDNPAREAGGKATVLLLDAVARRIVTLDDATRTYTEMTEEDMKRMRGQMDAMRTQMEERMKSMPPEQRKKMEEMMAQRGGGPAGAMNKPHEWTFEPLGQKKTINGFSCEMYRVNVDGKSREEDCVTPWSAGLVKKEDFAGLQKFGEEMSKEFGGGDSERGHGLFMKFEKSPGLPISRVPVGPDGKRGEEDQVKSIKRGAVAPALFAIPAGYTKKELPMGPHGPGARRHGPEGH